MIKDVCGWKFNDWDGDFPLTVDGPSYTKYDRAWDGSIDTSDKEVALISFQGEYGSEGICIPMEVLAEYLRRMGYKVEK